MDRRDQHAHMQVQVPIANEPRLVYASIHRDKIPMLLVHTCRTSLKGLARLRKFRILKDGNVFKKDYWLE